MRKIILIILFISCLNANPGSSYYYGHSARALSLSSALVANQYQTFQSISNPALLSQCQNTNYGLSYFMMSQDRSIQTFYFSKGLPGNAGVSIAILRTTIGEFMGKDSFNNPTKELSVSDYYGLLSFGLGDNNKNGIGLSMRIHYSNLYVNELHVDKYTGSSIMVDFGGTFSIFPQWQIGLKVQNAINPYLTWDINLGDGLSHTYDEQYPLMLILGSSLEIYNVGNFMLQKDLYFSNETNKVYNHFFRFGYEHFISEQFKLRAGFQEENKFHFGFGYEFNLTERFPLILDYSLDLGSENEGVSHLFSWNFNLK